MEKGKIKNLSKGNKNKLKAELKRKRRRMKKEREEAKRKRKKVVSYYKGSFNNKWLPEEINFLIVGLQKKLTLKQLITNYRKYFPENPKGDLLVRTKFYRIKSEVEKSK
jgi:hypothetical protein